MEQVIREWLELAEMDYGVAMHLFGNYNPFFSKGEKITPVEFKISSNKYTGR